MTRLNTLAPKMAAQQQAPAPHPALAALCAIARLHPIAADPATLAHQLGLAPLDPVSTHDLLRAAQHIGLKAKRSKTTVDRLELTALPAQDLRQSGARRVPRNTTK